MAAPIRTIQHSDSLDTVWEELVYTEARLESDKDAKDFAKDIAELIERTEGVRQGQLKVWRAEIAAQARVDAADDALDDDVDDVDTELLHVVRQNRSSPRYKHYFSKPKHEVIRLGLQSQLGKVRTWPDSLKNEAEKTLQKLGTRLAATIEEGDAALNARLTAAQQRAMHRVTEIIALIDDVNAARRSLYGALVTRGEERGRDPEWAGRFFRRTVRSPKKVKAGEPEKAPE